MEYRHCVRRYHQSRRLASRRQDGLEQTLTKDEHLREVLFRDAVVSYAKPFSDNRGVFTKKGLRISDKGIPDHLKSAHLEIIGLRDKLFAHMDLDRQSPELRHYKGGGEKYASFSVTGYGKVYADHLIEPLGQLANVVFAYLLKELRSIETNHF